MGIKEELIKAESDLRLRVIKSRITWKAEEGDKKTIFGRPYEWKGGKWVPTEGGSKNKPEKEPKEKKLPAEMSPKELKEELVNSIQFKYYMDKKLGRPVKNKTELEQLAEGFAKNPDMDLVHDILQAPKENKPDKQLKKPINNDYIPDNIKDMSKTDIKERINRLKDTRPTNQKLIDQRKEAIGYLSKLVGMEND